MATTRPLGDVVEVLDDETVFFHTKEMQPDTPYLFHFLDHNMAVILSHSGAIEVFYFPKGSQ